MKKIIYLFSIVFLLVSMIGCGDDDSNGSGGSSSTTGVDFSSDDAFNALDSYFVINNIDDGFGIVIATKSNVTSSELIINGNTININDYWLDFSEIEESFAYGLVIDEAMLPETVIFEPGVELDIHFNLNGTTFNNVLTIPFEPNVQEVTLDLESDFTVNWTINQSPQVQVVDLQGESYFWDEEDEGFWLDAEVSGATRSYTFSKSNYSDYILTGLSWYEYGVQAINYNLSGKNIMVLSSENYIEDFNFKNIDTNEKILKTTNLVKSLVK